MAPVKKKRMKMERQKKTVLKPACMHIKKDIEPQEEDASFEYLRVENHRNCGFIMHHACMVSAEVGSFSIA